MLYNHSPTGALGKTIEETTVLEKTIIKMALKVKKMLPVKG